MGDLLGVGLLFADQRLEPGLQVWADAVSKPWSILPAYTRSRPLSRPINRPSNLLALSAKPAIASVSRCAQVFFTQSFVRLSRTLETTPSSPMPQACLNIS